MLFLRLQMHVSKKIALTNSELKHATCNNRLPFDDTIQMVFTCSTRLNEQSS